MSLLEPKMEDLLVHSDSRFTLVMEVAKRGRQINDYFNAIRRQELINVKGPQITSVTKQPLSIALEEVAQGKVKFKRTTDGTK
jgi:DNA-directed RNA polymerase subunit omega